MYERILVVDDEAAIVDGLTTLLDFEHFETAGAGDREGAVRILERAFYPVILADLCLGTKEEGLLLLQHIRETSPRSRVVVLSAYASPGMAEELLLAGVAAVLQKPATGDAILSAVHALLEALEEQLVAADGDVDFEALYEKVHARLHAIARGRFRLSPERADDVVQEAWLLFLRKRGQIRSASPWLSGTVANLARQELDHGTRRRETPDGETALTFVPSAQAGGDVTQTLFLRQAMGRADERTRTLCALIGMEGLSYEQVSEATGLAVGSVGPLYMRAKQRMRELLSH